MADKAVSSGLAFIDNWQSKISPSVDGVLYNSANGLFALLPKFIRPLDLSVTTVDESVYNRMKADASYRPKNITTSV